MLVGEAQLSITIESIVGLGVSVKAIAPKFVKHPNWSVIVTL